MINTKQKYIFVKENKGKIRDKNLITCYASEIKITCFVKKLINNKI